MRIAIRCPPGLRLLQGGEDVVQERDLPQVPALELVGPPREIALLLHLGGAVLVHFARAGEEFSRELRIEVDGRLVRRARRAVVLRVGLLPFELLHGRPERGRPRADLVVPPVEHPADDVDLPALRIEADEPAFPRLRVVLALSRALAHAPAPSIEENSQGGLHVAHGEGRAKEKGPWTFAQGPAFLQDSCSPTRTRTSDLVINSHPLYRLSYRGICPSRRHCVALMTRFLENGALPVNSPV